MTIPEGQPTPPKKTDAGSRPSLGVWSPYMGHVGTIRAVLNICRGLRETGHRVDLIRVREEWEGAEDFLKTHGIKLVDFGGRVVFPWLPRHGKGFRLSMGLLSVFSVPLLWWYLQRRKPDVLLVCLLGFLPMMVLRFSPHKPKVILSVQGIPTFNKFRCFLWKHFQSRCDAVVALTENTRTLLLAEGIRAERLHRIDNPVLDEGVRESALQPAGHPWLDEKDRPVLIGIGRLTRQKDFPTLIRTFALLRAQRPCRLVILGEGEGRPVLEALARELGVADDVLLPGFASNPYKWLARADVFVLTSLWEDPGHVLLEAAYLDVPIVSTDCPSGPRDVLDGGALGTLCPMGDGPALAAAVADVLDHPNPERVRRAREKSLNYTIPACVGHYAGLMDALQSAHNR
jgi:glycosyltransferase involved in cell wall biosynthesis